MKKWLPVLMVLGIAVVLVACGDKEVAQQAAGGAAAVETAKATVKVATQWGTGWFVHLFLIVIPLLIVLVKLFRESEATSDSLISLEGQLRRLNNKIDDLEASLKGEKKS
jgi:putative copper export protein